MGAITPAFMIDLETNMRLITNNEYQRLGSNVWWPKIAKKIETTTRKERLIWMLETARIQRTGRLGGNIEFEDLMSQTTEIEAENAAGGLKIKKEDLDDLDGKGLQVAAEWSRQIGAYAAYWPQKQVAKAILSNPVTYDGQAFFSTAHPVNPFNTNAGNFANVFTGAASGAYPGALPIDTSVTLDVAVNNMSKAIAYAATLKMPNGEDPRMLKISALVVPPALAARAAQLTSAKYIAQPATGGGAAPADVEAIVRNWGLGEPIVAPELGAAFGGSDTDYYLLMDEILGNSLGAFTYIEREPFSVLYYGPQNDAQLARIREFQWMTEGRNSVGAGHPYLIFKCRST
jgi:phage major head subunit gpT-like protein